MWNFNSNEPIYIQIVRTLKNLIINGTYPPGSKLPTVRDLALESKVNPNTIQKAFQILEQEELIKTDRTIGKYVTEDNQKIDFVKDEMAKNLCETFVRNINNIKFGLENAIRILEQYKEAK